MRARPTDMDGNELPFTDFLNYDRLMVLVPEALCNTRAGKITAWRDERPQPTYDEIEAVTDEQAAAYRANIDDNALTLENLLKRIETLEAHPGNS